MDAFKTDADRLADLMKSVRNKSKFARDFNISGGSSMIYQHTKGLRPISLEAAQAYAKGLGCNLEDISPSLAKKFASIKSNQMDNNIEPASNQSSYVPLVSWVQAGNWEIPMDDRGKYDMVQCPIKQHSEKTFALTVRGISMYDPSDPKSFEEGDTIFVDPAREAISGNMVIAMHDGSYEATFKQLVIEDGKKYLHALNPNWQPNLQEITQDTYICGVVIARIKTTTYV